MGTRTAQAVWWELEPQGGLVPAVSAPGAERKGGKPVTSAPCPIPDWIVGFLLLEVG